MFPFSPKSEVEPGVLPPVGSTPAPEGTSDAPPAGVPIEPTPEVVPPVEAPVEPSAEVAEPVRRVRHRDVLSHREVEIEGRSWVEVSLSDATTEHVAPDQFAQLNENT